MHACATEVEVLRTTAQLEQLQPQWEQLWCEDPRATPFQSPHWLLPWWKHVGKGDLCTLAWRDDGGTLVGLAPLYLHTDASGTRNLFPVGIGTSDYLGVLARPAFDAAGAVLEGVAAIDGWEVLTFPQLRQDDPLLARQPGLELHAGEPNPVLALAPAAIPRSTLANLRTCRNRAARAGRLSYETATTATHAEFMDALARLHAQRWRERGESGVLADASVQAAHAEAAPLLLQRGLLRLHGLRLDDELVAVLYALQDPPERGARRCYYYIAGFEPRHGFFSPGTLLLAHAIEQATAEGAVAFDFLRGAEAYKYRWGAVDQPMFTLRWRREPGPRRA